MSKGFFFNHFYPYVSYVFTSRNPSFLANNVDNETNKESKYNMRSKQNRTEGNGALESSPLELSSFLLSDSLCRCSHLSNGAISALNLHHCLVLVRSKLREDSPSLFCFCWILLCLKHFPHDDR